MENLHQRDTVYQTCWAKQDYGMAAIASVGCAPFMVPLGGAAGFVIGQIGGASEQIAQYTAIAAAIALPVLVGCAIVNALPLHGKRVVQLPRIERAR